MTLFRTAAALLLSVGGTAWASVPPATGQGGGATDPNYRLPSGSTYLVTNVPTAAPHAWGSQAGGQWIGPTADGSHVPGTGGNFVFTLTFTVTDPSKVNLKMSVMADPDADIQLNGAYLANQPAINPVSPTSITLTSGFVAGSNNTLTFNVSDFGTGPVGLNVVFSGTLGDGSTGGGTTPADTGRKTYTLDALADPVDGSSGQYYETEVDLSLGGPMMLGFSRYYSSALAGAGASSALGTNWMSNYDLKATVSGSSVLVLLFGGRLLTFNKSGATWQIASPADIQYQFAQTAAGYQLMSPGSKLVYTFSSTGALTAIQDRNGNIITVSQGAHGPVSVTDGLGRTLTFTYSGTQLTSVQDQSNRAFAYAYTGGTLASVTDPMNSVTQYTYTAAGAFTGLMTRKQLALGNAPATQTYDSSGRVIAQSDPNNNTTRLAYDGAGGTTITDPLGNITRHAADSNGDLAKLTDPGNASAGAVYDSFNRRTSVTDKLGNKTTFTYHLPTGFVASVTDALGKTVSNTYTPQVQGSFTFFNLSAVTYPDGTSKTMAYDANGNLLSVTGRDGNTRKFTYDAHGSLTKLTDASGQSSTYAYNADGTVASVSDPTGNVTAFAYDNLKHLGTITGPNGGVERYSYDANSRILNSTDPLGKSASDVFDANGRLSQRTSPRGGMFAYAYTGTGKLASLIDPLNNKTTYSYDADDRLTTIRLPAGEANSIAYDPSNRPITLSNNAGTQFSFAYDAEGRMLSRTDATARKTSYTYDALGRVSGVTTSGGHVYTRAYDAFGNRTSTTDPLGQTQIRTFDSLNRLTKITQPGSISTSLTRNLAGLPASITTPNGNTWSITYDALQHPAKITDPLGNSTSFAYLKNQLSAITLPLGSVNVTTDLDGRIVQRAFSDGTTINTAYDSTGLLISADGVSIQRDAAGQASLVNGVAVAYDPDGRASNLTYAAGKTVSYGYDNAGRLSTVTDWVGGVTTLTHDAANRIATLTYPNRLVTTYSYDPDGNLIGVAMGGVGSIALTRDAAGKITSANRSLPITPPLQTNAQQFSYDSAAQLTGASYDAMGRVTSQSGRTYVWNLASQLTSFHDGVNSGAFTYDGLGEIATSTVSGAQQSFVFNYTFDLPALLITRQAAADLHYYVYLPDGTLIYSIEAADQSRHFYHFDEMGNTAFLTGDSGAVTDSYAITPYGDVALHAGTSDNPFTWQGQFGVIQEGGSLYYVRDRHYDASTARFISRDPVMSLNPRSAEPYAYAAGNPLQFIDPFGSDFGSFLAGGLSAVGNFAQGVVSDAETGISDVGNAVVSVVAPVVDTAVAVVDDVVDFVAPVVDAVVTTVVDVVKSVLPKRAPAASPPAPAPGPIPITATATCAKLSAPCAQVSLGRLAAANLLSLLAGPVFILNPSNGQLYDSNLQPVIDVPGVGLISQDGATLAGPDASIQIQLFGGATIPALISHDGGSLISHDGGSLISHDGGSLISHDGGSVISNDGGSLVNFANGLVSTVNSGLISNLAALIGEGGGG